MIVLFGTRGCRGCEAIREALEELCLAHRVVEVSGEGDSPEPPPEGALPPVLVDGREVVQGHRRISAHLDELGRIKSLWDKYQSDACYCDEEGKPE